MTVVKEALSAYQKACWLFEDLEEESGESYGAARGGNSGGRTGGTGNTGNSGGGSYGNYGRRRRDSRGRYMDGGYFRGGYGWMPGPYYDGGNRYGLAEDLERMAQTSGNDAERNAYRDAARYLRQG